MYIIFIAIAINIMYTKYLYFSLKYVTIYNIKHIT